MKMLFLKKVSTQERGTKQPMLWVPTLYVIMSPGVPPPEHSSLGVCNDILLPFTIPPLSPI